MSLKGWTIFAFALASAVALAGLLGGPGPRAVAASDIYRRFLDAVGDAPHGFEIKEVRVSNTDEGQIALEIEFANMPTLSPKFAMMAQFDTDANLDNGVNGIDYVVGVDKDGPYLQRATRSGYEPVATPKSLSWTFDKGVGTLRVDRRDLGGAKRFRFFVATVVMTPGNPPIDQDPRSRDDAPGIGDLWTYALSGPPKLTASAASLQPARPLAGRAFTVRMKVRDHGEPSGLLRNGQVRCNLSIGGRRLRAFGGRAAQSGIVSCRAVAPRSTAGKRLTGTITYETGGVSVSRALTALVA